MRDLHTFEERLGTTVQPWLLSDALSIHGSDRGTFLVSEPVKSQNRGSRRGRFEWLGRLTEGMFLRFMRN